MEKKTFDKRSTKDKFEQTGVRIAMDAETKENRGGEKFVRVKFVSESDAPSDEEIWIEAVPVKSEQDLAAFLRKGDILHMISGKLTLRRYGDPCQSCGQKKIAHNLRNARFDIPKELLAKLKERGFVPKKERAATQSKPPMNLDDE
jgi:hypothetical protein